MAGAAARRKRVAYYTGGDAMKRGACSVAGCPCMVIYAKGQCKKHYVAGRRAPAPEPAPPAVAGLGTLSLPLACKLASIAVHAEEYLSPHGHDFDRVALLNNLADPAVRAWLAEMAKAGFAPVKRNA